MGWNNSSNDSNDDLDIGFDTASVDPSDAPSFDLIKNGEYPGVVTGGKMKAGKKEGSRYASIEVTLLPESGHKGRKIWGNFTTHNSNAQAVTIGRAQLTMAFNLAGVSSSSLADLVSSGEPMLIVVGTEKGTAGYADKNTIKGFKPMNGAAPATSSKPAASSKPGFLNNRK